MLKKSHSLQIKRGKLLFILITKQIVTVNLIEYSDFIKSKPQ